MKGQPKSSMSLKILSKPPVGGAGIPYIHRTVANFLGFWDFSCLRTEFSLI